jgi:hypothetical protein
MYTSGDSFARLAVSIAALLVVGVAVDVAVVRGGRIDVGTLVYAIPAGAIACRRVYFGVSAASRAVSGRH